MKSSRRIRPIWKKYSKIPGRPPFPSIWESDSFVGLFESTHMIFYCFFLCNSIAITLQKNRKKSINL
jgi:hypothetical protein